MMLIYINIYHESYFFWSFMINELIRGCFEYLILFQDLPEVVSSVTFIITAHEHTE